MKKMINKRGQLAIAAACFFLVLSMTVISTYADESGTCGENANWTLSNGVLVISGNGDMMDYAENEWAPWFDSKDEITSVIINNGITTIGNTAFYGLSNLKSVVIADSVTFIGESAFQECISLTSVEMSDGIVQICDSAFRRCTNLSNITLPNGLNVIEDEAFYRCESLVSIRIPSTVYLLGDAVFGYCYSLVQVDIEASIGEIPSWAFYGCESLVNVTLNSAIDSVGEDSFTGCNSLSTVSSNSIRDLSESVSNQTGTEVIVKENDESDVLKTEVKTDTEQKEIVESSGTIIQGTVTDDGIDTDVTIDAIIKDESGWNTLIDEVLDHDEKNQAFGTDKDLIVNVIIQKDQELSGAVLEELAGKEIKLNIQGNSTSFSISCKDLEANNYKNLNLNYELQAIENPEEAISNILNGSPGYLLKFKGNVDYNITVKVYLGNNNQTASLYQKNGKEWSLIQSVKIDSNGYASFYLDGYDVYTDYLIGINTEDSKSNVLLSEEEYDNYGGLMDEFGNKYEITGVESRWGITLGQFTMYVAFALIAVVALVGVVMYVLYKKSQMQANLKKMHQK